MIICKYNSVFSSEIQFEKILELPKDSTNFGQQENALVFWIGISLSEVPSDLELKVTKLIEFCAQTWNIVIGPYCNSSQTQQDIIFYMACLDFSWMYFVPTLIRLIFLSLSFSFCGELNSILWKDFCRCAWTWQVCVSQGKWRFRALSGDWERESNRTISPNTDMRNRPNSTRFFWFHILGHLFTWPWLNLGVWTLKNEQN